MKPNKLKVGDKLAVIAPASPYAHDDYDRIKANIQALGFEAELLPTCFLSHGHFAGSDDERLRDLHEAFENQAYKGIICLKGGYGTPRLLEKLDMDLIKSNFKPFIGYSDITALHVAFNNIGLVTFHGPMASSKLEDDYTLDHMKKVLLDDKPLCIENPQDEQIKVLVEGKCQGKIVGGNLSLLASTLGSPYEIDTRGKILFIEEINEPIYVIDRMLTSLNLAGKFRDCVGVILGTFTGCVSDKDKEDLRFDQVIEEIIIPYKKPTIINLRAGHNFPQPTIPFNVMATLDTKMTKLTFEEGATV
ncbi:LD-carboxypeptidase [Acidaminobacter sp. JC074]|uniref:S66 peptidase family protein n=1 Tax=Acidaminobacter sp. JC074 TaxID=2530199 RepID=UPI001F0FAC99|nr:LD-carboxypeptidase [Acidaminobacter sp. JC074]